MENLKRISDEAAKQAAIAIDKAYDAIRTMYQALNAEASEYDKNDMLSNGKSAYDVFSNIADSVQGNAFHVVKECNTYVDKYVRELSEARKLTHEEKLPFDIIPVSGYSNIKEMARSLIAKLVKEYKLSNGSLKFAPQGSGNYDAIIELRLNDKNVYARFDARGYGVHGHFQVYINDKSILDNRYNNDKKEGQDSVALAIYRSKDNEASVRKFLDTVLVVIK